MAIPCAIASSILSSYGIIFEGQAVHYLGAPLVIVLGPLLGGIILLGVMLLSNAPPSNPKQPPTTQIPSVSTGPRLWLHLADLRRCWPDLLKLVVLRTILGRVFFVYGLALTPSIKAMFFTKAEPYLIMFFFWLWGIEKLDRRHLLLLSIHIAGAILLSTGGEFSFDHSITGDLLIFSALVVSAVSYRYAQKLSHELGALRTTAWSQTLGGIIGVPWLLYLLPPELGQLANPGWLHLVAFVLLFNVLSLTLWYVALQSVSAWRVSALRAIGPLAAAPCAWWFFNQTLSPLQMAGGFLVLLTSALIALQHWQSQQQRKPETATPNTTS